LCDECFQKQWWYFERRKHDYLLKNDASKIYLKTFISMLKEIDSFWDFKDQSNLSCQFKKFYFLN
jgi:hypothetical protein